MNGLTALMLLVILVLLGVLLGYALKHSENKKKLPFIVGIALTTVAAACVIYGTFGRYGEWQQQKVDEDVDYLLAAKVTKAKRAVQNMPGNTVAQMQLAESYIEGARYREAVDVLDECLKTGGEAADVLGRKAFAMYYRDGRQFTSETRAVIDRVLKLNRLDVQTRMLLGQDAFLNKRYAEAIEHWKLLLDSRVAPDKETALRNAIAKAETMAKMQN